MICPNCGKAELKRRDVPFVQGDVYLGDFTADVCPVCGEVLFTEEASEAINKRAVELGVWGRRLIPEVWPYTVPTEAEDVGARVQTFVVEIRSAPTNVRKVKELRFAPQASTA